MIDDARRDQIQAAVGAAIVDAATLVNAEGQRAIIDTAATVDALVNVIASLMAPSAELVMPRSRRAFGEAMGKVVTSRIAAAQRHFAAVGATSSILSPQPTEH
ncbi:hypothetical protein [Sphingomonas sp.]|jgi:hypothetical protein|uniref:hypothetical protein n=1 Tax=Sphingomonas sp. TaxID=28214 RepID=UPI0026215284|nr:hypothetical protein [Sphingomonas sp.]MDF2493278.1 hypothetical protein [Sphingomonas sp.]